MKEIPLTKNKIALVDDEDYPVLSQWEWYYHNQGYAARIDRTGDKQKTLLMHRQILCAPQGTRIDHRNRNKLDNQRGNLRYATASQNGQNALWTKRTGTTSRYKGVSWQKSARKWEAQIVIGREASRGIKIYLGCYGTQEDAARAYDSAARTHFGEFALTNFAQ